MNRAAEPLLHDCGDAGEIWDDLNIPAAVTLINGMLMPISRWYRPSGRLTQNELHAQVLAVLDGVIIPPSTQESAETGA